MPNNFTSSFMVMRQKIEKMIEDGFSFKNNSLEETKDSRKELVKSPIEQIHEQKERERMDIEELDRQEKKRMKHELDMAIKE
jgi:hypothetical protein